MSFFYHCNSDTSFDEIGKRVNLLISFIQQYRWIIESYVSDFYTQDHWSKVPPSVRHYVDRTDPPDWAWLLEEKGEKDNLFHSNKPAPLILLALKAYTSYLCVNRTAVNLDDPDTIENIAASLKSDHPGIKVQSKSQTRRKEDSHNVNCTSFHPSNYKNGQCMDMQHIFRKHVKPKKQHEIQKLGQSIQGLSEMSCCKNVIDVGAGLGHLSRLLTFSYGLKVTTLEADSGHAPRACDFDREMRKDMLKKLTKFSQVENRISHSSQSSASSNLSSAELDCSPPNNISQHSVSKDIHVTGNCQTDSIIESPADSTTSCEKDLPSHIVCFIRHNMKSSEFLDIVKQNRVKGSNDTDEDKFILTGLHACGDLSPLLMRFFLECPSIIGLASVACCYMKMDHSTINSSCENRKELSSYPMSNLLKAIPNNGLNYETREMACHFIDAYFQRLRENPSHLKVHSYRAALQHMVTEVNPNFQSGQVRLVTKKGAQTSFLHYATETLKKLSMNITEIPQKLVESCQEMTEHWKRVVAFYTIRLSLAPVVESLILLDRVLSLKENGVNSVLVPIFDSKVSPRNFVILAAKSPNNIELKQ